MARKPAPTPRMADTPPIDPVAASGDIVARCVQAGFALVGVARARPSMFGAHLRAWLAAGKAGEMEYLARDVELRIEPAHVLKGTQSFIAVADQYATRGAQDGACDGAGRIARYARGRNYHEVMKRRLHRVCDQLRRDYPGSEFRTCVDTAPIMEREIAAWAGLGWQGKHTLLIHPRIGSYFVLGVVATTLELAELGEAVPDSCGTCTRCIEACPTQAIRPYSVDASRCVSYLTIERRSVIPSELHSAMGDWIFGCDICQEVCPHNSGRSDARRSGDAFEAYEARQSSLPLLEVLGWDEAKRRAAFINSAMKRANLVMMKRNALIVLGNQIAAARAQAQTSAIDAGLARVRELAVDPQEAPMVRDTAKQILERLLVKF